jgi:PKD repeat protein
MVRPSPPPARAGSRRLRAVSLCAILGLTLAACGGGDPPVADFTAQPTSGETPLTVTFTDTSSGDPDSWSWEFGDGGSSAEQSPTHVYEEPGTYRVILTATNGEGSDDVVKADVVTVTAPPLNAFCQSVSDLGDTVDRLIDPSTLTGGVEGVRSALAEVQAAVAEVRASGGEEYGDEIDRVESAIAAVSSVVDSVQDDAGLQEVLGELASAGLEVVAAVNALRSAVQQGCEPSEAAAG